jgi:hypothetical protein
MVHFGKQFAKASKLGDSAPLNGLSLLDCHCLSLSLRLSVGEQR